MYAVNYVSINGEKNLYEGAYALNAVRRYLDLWVPLVKKERQFILSGVDKQTLMHFSYNENRLKIDHAYDIEPRLLSIGKIKKDERRSFL